MKKRRSGKNNVSSAGIVAWGIVIIVCTALTVLINRRDFRNQTMPPSTVNEQLEFPLNKVTVNLKKSEFKKVLKKCSWIKPSNNLGASISIVPEKSYEETFEKIVNENGNAEKLADLYGDYGFKWNNDEKKLTLPVHSSSVTVPAWLVFKLVEDGLFPALETEEE